MWFLLSFTNSYQIYCGQPQHCLVIGAHDIRYFVEGMFQNTLYRTANIIMSFNPVLQATIEQTAAHLVIAKSVRNASSFFVKQGESLGSFATLRGFVVFGPGSFCAQIEALENTFSQSPCTQDTKARLQSATFVLSAPIAKVQVVFSGLEKTLFLNYFKRGSILNEFKLNSDWDLRSAGFFNSNALIISGKKRVLIVNLDTGVRHILKMQPHLLRQVFDLSPAIYSLKNPNEITIITQKQLMSSISAMRVYKVLLLVTLNVASLVPLTYLKTQKYSTSKMLIML